MKIRKIITRETQICSNEAKSIALLMYMLHSGNSSVSSFSYNRLHEISGLHATTLRKRIAYLVKIGLAVISNGVIQFKSAKSRNESRNLNLNTVEENIEKSKGEVSVRDYENIINSLIATQPVRKKEFVKHIITKRNNPNSLREMKKMRNKSRKLGLEDKFEYKEYGISLETLASKCGCSKTTIVALLNFACKFNIISKFTSRSERVIPMNIIGGCINNFIKYNSDNDFTYCYENNNLLHLVKVNANRYETQRHMTNIDW